MSQQARRRRRRPARRNVEGRSHEPALDSVIDLIFDSGAIGGAFEMPWRSGINAARVVASFLHVRATGAPISWRFSSLPTQIEELQSLIERGRAFEDLRTAYELASHLAREAYLSGGVIENDRIVSRGTAEVTYASHVAGYARIVQLYASNSHGGGHAYNVLLQQLDDLTSIEDEDVFHAAVMLARAHDAIGTSYQLANDGHDAVRNAFKVLWQGNHHRAIYALPQIKA